MKLALDEKLPRIKGNPGKLQQVFLNLFLNARDAMESGGTLAVRSSLHGNPGPDRLVRVTVADSGAGIAAENLTRIFDPFFTTKAAKKAPAWGFRSATASSRSTAAKLKSRASWAPERALSSRSRNPFPNPCRNRRFHARRRAADGSRAGARAEPLRFPLPPVTAVSSPSGAVAQSNNIIQ